MKRAVVGTTFILSLIFGVGVINASQKVSANYSALPKVIEVKRLNNENDPLSGTISEEVSNSVTSEITSSNVTSESSVISSSEEETSTQITSSTITTTSSIVVDSETTQESEKATEEEKDTFKEDIEKLLNEYLNKNFAEQTIFGVSLGAIIAFLVSNLGTIINVFKNSKSGQKVLDLAQDTTNKIKELASENEALRELLDKITEQNKEAVEMYKEMVQELTEKMGEYGGVTDLVHELIDLILLELSKNTNVPNKEISEILNKYNYLQDENKNEKE